MQDRIDALAQELKQRRLALSMSREELLVKLQKAGESMGYHTLANVESGRHVSLRSLLQLSTVLGPITIGWQELEPVGGDDA